MTAIPSQSHTPEGIELPLRDRRHDLENILATDWLGGDAYATAWFNAMSLTFPVGESSFIDSIRFVEHLIEDPKLKAEAKAFYAQEGVHRREHRHYNEMLCEKRDYEFSGFPEIDMDAYKEVIRGLKERASSLDPEAFIPWVGGTAASEHITALFAEKLLGGWKMNGVAEPMHALWRWHSLEELEHKSVAFDVFRVLVGDAREEHKVRRKLTLLTAYTFIKNTRGLCREMLRRDGQLGRWKTRWQAFRFWFGRDGVVRHFLWPYLQFARRNFHPWERDTRELARQTMAKFPELQAAA